MANDTVKLTFEGVDDVSDVIKKINKGLQTTEKQTKKTTKSTEMMGVAAKAAGAFIATYLVKQSIDATIELSKLAGKAQLVEKNFRNFARNAGKDANDMMASLRKATLGMVDDIRLQQNAMKAMISGVEFDDMITAMEYVTKYAAATGDDVNVKMTTVMTGLARKSALFMDDVGIQVMGAEDVVRATIDQMKEKMGQFATSEEDVAMKMANLATEFRNAGKELSKALIPTLQEVLPLLEKMAQTANAVASGIAAMANKTVQKNEMLVVQMEKWAAIRDKAFKDQQELMAIQEKTGYLTDKESKAYLRAVEDYDVALSKLAELTGKTIAGPQVEATQKIKTTTDEKVPEWKTQEGKYKAAADMMELLNQAAKNGTKVINDQEKIKTDVLRNEIDERVKLMEEMAQIERELMETQLEYEAEVAEERKQRMETAMQTSLDVAYQTSALIEQALSARFAREREDIDRNTAKKREAIKESTLSEKQKNKELEKLDKEAQKARHEIAMKDWRMNLIMAIANTAMGVTKALSSSSPPLNFVMAALTGAAGAASVATIAASKPKGFATGGKVGGNSFTGDQVDVRVNSGERIITTAQENRLSDVLEGRSPMKSVSKPVNVTLGDSNIIIQGNADQGTVEALERENLSHREKIAEMLYQLADSGELDTTRLPFAVA